MAVMFINGRKCLTTGVENCGSYIEIGQPKGWGKGRSMKKSMIAQIAELFSQEREFNEEADSFTRGEY